MSGREWLEIRITLPETLQEEAGIFLTAWSGRGVVLEDGEETAGNIRFAGIRTYFPAADFTADNRRDLLQYLDKLVSLGYRIGELEQRIIEEEDWERAWQVHFKTRRLTSRIVVRPPWEEYTADCRGCGSDNLSWYGLWHRAASQHLALFTSLGRAGPGLVF